MPDATTTQSAGDAIAARKDTLAQAIVELQYARQPAIWALYSERGRAKSIRDTAWHLSYLAEALALNDMQMFVQYADWTKTLFAGLKFPPEVLTSTLECMRDVLPPALAEPMGEVITTWISAALAHLQQPAEAESCYLLEGAPLADLARQYLDLLLKGERQAASWLILNAVDTGAPARDIYLQVFQPALREVGRLWQTNQVTVAQEHYCTASTQLIMAQLYPRIFSAARNGRRMVATCVGGELHEIGLRMVADFFEMAGWDTYYLGANMPAHSVVQAVVDRRADVLAISATMTFHIRLAVELIQAIRANERTRSVRILVGGYPFNLSPDLWRQVGADGHAADADAAIALANQWTCEQGEQ